MMTERLDRIEESIAQLNATLNIIADEFIRPIAQQSRANFERLERIEAVLERTAQRAAANTAQSAANEEQIAANVEALALLAVRAAETDARFNVLVGEMRADRPASQQAFQALLLQLAGINSRVEDLEQTG